MTPAAAPSTAHPVPLAPHVRVRLQPQLWLVADLQWVPWGPWIDAHAGDVVSWLWSGTDPARLRVIWTVLDVRYTPVTALEQQVGPGETAVFGALTDTT